MHFLSLAGGEPAAPAAANVLSRGPTRENMRLSLEGGGGAGKFDGTGAQGVGQEGEGAGGGEEEEDVELQEALRLSLVEAAPGEGKGGGEDEMAAAAETCGMGTLPQPQICGPTVAAAAASGGEAAKAGMEGAGTAQVEMGPKVAETVSAAAEAAAATALEAAAPPPQAETQQDVTVVGGDVLGGGGLLLDEVEGDEVWEEILEQQGGLYGNDSADDDRSYDGHQHQHQHPQQHQHPHPHPHPHPHQHQHQQYHQHQGFSHCLSAVCPQAATWTPGLQNPFEEGWGWW